jgi:ribonuclease E
MMEEEAPVAEPAVPEKTDSDATDVAISAKAPEAPVENAPAVEAVPAVEQPVPAVEPAAALEPAPIAEPVAEVEADPFSAEEIPAAEIVVPQEPKKHWWKFF